MASFPLKLILGAAAICLAGQPSRAHDVSTEMAAAAKNLLASLSTEQCGQINFAFTNDERFNWHFIPRARKGLAFRDMTLTQQQLAHVLVQTPLSHRGYFKAVTIMSLDQVLYELENHAPRREPGQYFISIFGEPGKAPWGWRVEGHHLSLNFTIGEHGAVATTPSFFGANPAEVRTGPRAGLRVLEREEELGFQLINSLDAAQTALAIIASNAPNDVITGTNRELAALKPPGITASKLNAEQRAVFTELLREFVFRHRAEIADADWKKIEHTDADKLFFAWAGGTKRGSGSYYRIQGPDFIMEFDNTQNNANHIHTVWRDLKNDFGDDLLRRHYEQTPHGK